MMIVHVSVMWNRTRIRGVAHSSFKAAEVRLDRSVLARCRATRTAACAYPASHSGPRQGLHCPSRHGCAGEGGGSSEYDGGEHRALRNVRLQFLEMYRRQDSRGNNSMLSLGAGAII